MKEYWEKALGWGLSVQELKHWYKQQKNSKQYELYVYRNYTVLGQLSIYNFIGDCGALSLCGANYADKENIELVEKLASANGFSKLFTTIVKEMNEIEKQTILNKWKGWTIIDISKSNRNKDKTDIVLFKRIECEYKGY
jgi:hypothetical protein